MGTRALVCIEDKEHEPIYYQYGRYFYVIHSNAFPDNVAEAIVPLVKPFTRPNVWHSRNQLGIQLASALNASAFFPWACPKLPDVYDYCYTLALSENGIDLYHADNNYRNGNAYLGTIHKTTFESVESSRIKMFFDMCEFSNERDRFSVERFCKFFASMADPSGTENPFVDVKFTTTSVDMHRRMVSISKPVPTLVKRDGTYSNEMGAIRALLKASRSEQLLGYEWFKAHILQGDFSPKKIGISTPKPKLAPDQN